MWKKTRKIMSILLFITIIGTIFKTAYASFWSDAAGWLNGVENDTFVIMMGNSTNTTIGGVIKEIEGYIEVIGTVVIVIATMVQGVKYMISSAQGKTAAKESLVSILVASILFFGWTNIASVLYPGGRFFLYQNAASFTTAVQKVYAIFKFVVEIVAIIAIFYMGIKYIFNGAEGKADLKGKSPQFLIGIILTFSAISFLEIVSKIVNNVF